MRGRPQKAAIRTHLPALVAPVALLGAVALAGSLGGQALEYRTVTMTVGVVLVVGLYIFVGNSGVFSFGHAAFMAVGAYVFGILRSDPVVKEALLPGLPGFLAHSHLAALPATLFGGLAAAALALVVAVPLMRLAGLSAALGTFALLLIVNTVISNWSGVTHGTAGLDVNATTTRDVALVWAIIAIVSAYLFRVSSSGLRLQASREDESAARAVGIWVARERGIAFVISAFFVGVGGALTAGQLGSFSPSAFYLSITFLTVAMLVVGGLTSVAGAVVGAITLSVLAELLRRTEAVAGITGLQQIGFAAVMLAILILRPAGITAGREFRLPSGNQRKRQQQELAECEVTTSRRPVTPDQQQEECP